MEEKRERRKESYGSRKTRKGGNRRKWNVLGDEKRNESEGNGMKETNPHRERRKEKGKGDDRRYRQRKKQVNAK